MDPFYDGQLERYLLQFGRMFSAFSVQDGIDSETGEMKYRDVPVIYGDIPRNAAHIIRGNSENMIESVPQMSYYITGIEPLESMRRAPHYQDVVQVTEKRFNEMTQRYEDAAGASYTVTRHQPVPYVMTLNLDLWTSVNAPIQKFQLWEQLTSLFNPSVDLLTNTSPLDWTALTYCELRSTQWTERSIPNSGTDDVIDIARLGFWMPIYMNPPMLVQKQNIVKSIIASMHTSPKEPTLDFAVDEETDETDKSKLDVAKVYLAAVDGVAGVEGAVKKDVIAWKWDLDDDGKEKKTGAWTRAFKSDSAQARRDHYVEWKSDPEHQLEWVALRSEWRLIPVIDTVNWTARDADGNLLQPDAGMTVVGPDDYRIRVWQSGDDYYVHLFDEGEDPDWFEVKNGERVYDRYKGDNLIPEKVGGRLDLSDIDAGKVDRDIVYLMDWNGAESESGHSRGDFKWKEGAPPGKNDLIKYDSDSEEWEIAFDASAKNAEWRALAERDPDSTGNGEWHASTATKPDMQLRWTPADEADGIGDWSLVRTPADWNEEVIEKDGELRELRPGITKLRLRHNMDSQEIFGAVDWHRPDGGDPVTRLLKLTIDKDTFHRSNIYFPLLEKGDDGDGKEAISADAFVDPNTGEGAGALFKKSTDTDHDAESVFILLADMPPSMEWVGKAREQNKAPKKNDIIRWKGKHEGKNVWEVVFDSSAKANATDRFIDVGEASKAERWHWTGSAANPDDRIWQHSVLGVYRPGFWRLAI